MSNQIDEHYLIKLYDEFSLERNAVLLKIRNNKEQTNITEQMAESKLLESLVINLVKLRNLKIKLSSKNR